MLAAAFPAGAAPYDIGQQLPSGVSTGVYRGFVAYTFRLDGREAKVVAPRAAAAGRPWIWRAEFFDHEPQTDVALLERGFHLAYIHTFGLNGSPEAMKAWEELYDVLRAAGLHPKPALIGMSRGGLYAYNWALLHPDRVGAVYADAPVLDIRSWPGGKGKGKGSPPTWAELLKQYGLTEETAKTWKGPLDRAEEIARMGFPMLHICGDADDVVPYDENTGPFVRRVRAAGGTIEEIVKPGIGHHPHSLKDPKPIVDFILRACMRKAEG